MRLRIPVATLALILAAAAAPPLVVPLTGDDGYAPGDDLMYRFEVADDVYVLATETTALRTSAGLQQCDGDFEKLHAPLRCGDVTASLTTTGERQSLPQLTEQYNNRSGRPAVLTITRAGGRQVLDGWWVEYAHSN